MEPTANLGVLQGVPLTLEVELGRRAITLGELLKLKAGRVVSLPRPAGGTLDIYVGSSLLGQAEVVSQGRQRKIQITEVAHV